MREIRRFWVAVSGLGMAAGAVLTIRHYFEANFPASIYEGSFCDLNAFFNCDSSAFSEISAVMDVPIGTFGLVLAILVVLSAVFSTVELGRTSRPLVMLNLLGVVALLIYSVFVLGSLCLLCSIYYAFSILAVWAFRRGRLLPNLRVLGVTAVLTGLVAVGMAEYHHAREDARLGGDTARIRAQFLDLPLEDVPTFLSPNWVERSTENFSDAPLRIVVWEDFLCPDCRFLAGQLKRLLPAFEGQANVVFQHFPLDATCNDVVDKDKHPGACELAVMTATSPNDFGALYEEIFEHQEEAKSEGWRSDFASRHGLSVEDSVAFAVVRAAIQTGTEYEQTSDEFAHGIRSTPTLLINERLVIGTFPDHLMNEMLRAALEDPGGARFIENWVDE